MPSMTTNRVARWRTLAFSPATSHKVKNLSAGSVAADTQRSCYRLSFLQSASTKPWIGLGLYYLLGTGRPASFAPSWASCRFKAS